MSKVIHDYSSMIEEASTLITLENKYIYPYTGDSVIDEIFSAYTRETLPEDETQEVSTEDKLLFKLLNLEREKLEEFVNNTTIKDIISYDASYNTLIHYYTKKENKTIEELVYFAFIIDDYGLKDNEGNHKDIWSLIK